MRMRVVAALLLGITGLAGCGGGETTNPADLPPLTAQDMELIKQEDARIQDEERGPVYVRTGKGNRTRGQATYR